MSWRTPDIETYTIYDQLRDQRAYLRERKEQEAADEAELARNRAACRAAGIPLARPCECDSPAFDTDIDGAQRCVWCGRAAR